MDNARRSYPASARVYGKLTGVLTLLRTTWAQITIDDVFRCHTTRMRQGMSHAVSGRRFFRWERFSGTVPLRCHVATAVFAVLAWGLAGQGAELAVEMGLAGKAAFPGDG